MGPCASRKSPSFLFAFLKVHIQVGDPRPRPAGASERRQFPRVQRPGDCQPVSGGIAMERNQPYSPPCSPPPTTAQPSAVAGALAGRLLHATFRTHFQLLLQEQLYIYFFQLYTFQRAKRKGGTHLCVLPCSPCSYSAG